MGQGVKQIIDEISQMAAKDGANKTIEVQYNTDPSHKDQQS